MTIKKIFFLSYRSFDANNFEAHLRGNVIRFNIMIGCLAVLRTMKDNKLATVIIPRHASTAIKYESQTKYSTLSLCAHAMQVFILKEENIV